MTGHQLSAPPPLPSPPAGVRTPGVPPLAPPPLPPRNMVERRLAARHTESQSHSPVWRAGWYRPTDHRDPLRIVFHLPGTRAGVKSPAAPLLPPPATWLNGNPTSQDLKSHFHGSASIDTRPLLAATRPGTDDAPLSSVTYRYREGRWRRWR